MAVSTSIITQKKYEIPTTGNDKEAIDAFLEKNRGKKVVVVQGLGFVGAVMSLVVANAHGEEYVVIGIDLANENSYWKIASINEGSFPVTSADPKIEKYYNQAREKGNLLATFDSYAYSKADVVIVDINLDVQKKSEDNGELTDYDVDLSPFKSGIKAIAQNCKNDILLLVETTVPPGTCKHVVQPLVKEIFKERGEEYNLKIGHSYERVMPGPKYIDSIENFYRVFAGVDEESAQATEDFLRKVIYTNEYPLTRLNNTNATEMAKVLENSYRAMNIAFIVEWSRFAEEANVNLYDVVQAIRLRPTHKNIMLPGIGVGGYCLTKDPLLASWAKQNIFNSEEPLGQSEKGVKINDRMPYYAYGFLKSFCSELKGKNVLLLGVSYLNDIGDTRYTPVEGLYKLLKQEEAKITLHDPYVPYWEEQDIHVEADLNAVLDGEYDLVVISTGHSLYRNNPELIEKLKTQKDIFVYDTIGVLNSKEINSLNEKFPTKVKVLGRGDL